MEFLGKPQGRGIGPVRKQKLRTGLFNDFTHAAGDVWRGFRHELKKDWFVAGLKGFYAVIFPATAMGACFQSDSPRILMDSNLPTIDKLPNILLSGTAAFALATAGALLNNLRKTGKNIRESGAYDAATGRIIETEIILPSGETLSSDNHGPDDIFDTLRRRSGRAPRHP